MSGAIDRHARRPFGENLKRLRERAGLSQDALARAVGVRQATLSKLELGQTQPRLRTAEALAAALGVGLLELVGGTR